MMRIKDGRRDPIGVFGRGFFDFNAPNSDKRTQVNFTHSEIASPRADGRVLNRWDASNKTGRADAVTIG